LCSTDRIKQARPAATQHGSFQFTLVTAATTYFFSDAHAYMLISSPTATSTILGAFQVMLSSLIWIPSSIQTGVDFVSLLVLVHLSL